MPKVYNKRHNNVPATAVYVGRPTKFGNPFSHLTSGTLAKYQVATRVEAVKKFEEWIRSQPKLMAAVKKELKGKDVICWCAPAACHGDVLIKIANEE
jgi:hypothetical protein